MKPKKSAPGEMSAATSRPASTPEATRKLYDQSGDEAG